MAATYFRAPEHPPSFPCGVLVPIEGTFRWSRYRLFLLKSADDPLPPKILEFQGDFVDTKDEAMNAARREVQAAFG